MAKSSPRWSAKAWTDLSKEQWTKLRRNDKLNDVLYRMCLDMPGHTDRGEVRAKVVVIGRSYASGLERHTGGDVEAVTTAGRFTSLADAHAWLIGEVRREIPNVPLVFCPTDYFGSGTEYQRTLGAQVAREVDMLWTGPEVCSPAISAGQARQVAAALRRRPLIWDNYPVNDLAMAPELLF